MCQVWATRFTNCMCTQFHVLRSCSAGYSTETFCRNDTNQVVSTTTACPLLCQRCYDHEESKLRNNYDQLISKTKDKGNAAGWCEEEIRRVENELMREKEEKLEKLRLGCYMAILEEYAES